MLLYTHFVNMQKWSFIDRRSTIRTTPVFVQEYRIAVFAPAFKSDTPLNIRIRIVGTPLRVHWLIIITRLLIAPIIFVATAAPTINPNIFYHLIIP